MDHGKDIEEVQRYLQEVEKKITKQKAARNEERARTQVERLEADLKMEEERGGKDNYILLQREQFDKGIAANCSELAKRVRSEQIAMVNKALNDQRATYQQKIKEERALSNQVLQNTYEQNDANLRKERENFDLMMDQARDQLEKSENECFKMKTLIESMIKRKEVRGNMNVEEEGMVHIPRRIIPIIIQRESGPDDVMKFKIHGVKEIYSDLQKYYDMREEFGEIGITKPDTVDYSFLSQHMEDYGCIGGAQLYYLNLAPGSEPSKALVKIDGQEDVDKMLAAHAHEGTKICDLYIVDGVGFHKKLYRPVGAFADNEDEDSPWQLDDYADQYDEENYPSGHAAEAPKQDGNSVTKKRRAE